MSPEEMATRVLEIVASSAGREPAALSLDTRLFGGGLDLDSLSVVRIVTRIEQELGVTLDDDDLDLSALESVGTLARFVKSQLAFDAGRREAGNQRARLAPESGDSQ
jgi:acyl carrier protein